MHPKPYFESEPMNHTEADYTAQGYKFERATTPDKARAVAQHLRAMLSSERPEDQTYARSLIEKGRSEARSRGTNW
jgi:hypothetical protein